MAAKHYQIMTKGRLAVSMEQALETLGCQEVFGEAKIGGRFCGHQGDMR